MNYRDYYKKESASAQLRNESKNSNIDPSALKEGIKYEMQNSTDERTARIIAENHLKNDPHYYSKLNKAGQDECMDECGMEDNGGLPKLGGALAIPHVGQPIHMSKIIQVGPVGVGGNSVKGTLSGMTPMASKKGVNADKGGVPAKVDGDREPITAGGKEMDASISSKAVGGPVVGTGKQGGPNTKGTYANTVKMDGGGTTPQTPSRGEDIDIPLQETHKSSLRKMVKEVLKEITFNKKSGKWERIDENRFAAAHPEDSYAQHPQGQKDRLMGDERPISDDECDCGAQNSPEHRPHSKNCAVYKNEAMGGGDRNFGASHGGFEPNLYDEEGMTSEELNMKMGPSYKTTRRQYRTSDDDQARQIEYEPEITEMYDEEEESTLQEQYFNLLTKKTLLKESDMEKMKKIKARLDYIRENKEKWIQGAINKSHKGFCTPMSKSTCTPHRKAFAMRAKHHDLEEGRCEDYPACGHEPGDCPDHDAEGNEVWGCARCGAKLPKHSESSLCNRCISKMHRVMDDDPTGQDLDNFEEASSTRTITIDPAKVVDIEVDGVDNSDYPDFSDAYISKAFYPVVEHPGQRPQDWRELTEEELEWLNDNARDLVHQAATEYAHNQEPYEGNREEQEEGLPPEEDPGLPDLQAAMKDTEKMPKGKRGAHIQAAGERELAKLRGPKKADIDDVDENTVKMRMGPSYKVVQPNLPQVAKQDRARNNQYDPHLSEAGGAAVQHSSYRVADERPQIPKNRHRGDIDETTKKSDFLKTIHKNSKPKTATKKQKLDFKAPKKTKSGVTKKRDE